ncbi:MAG: two-component sensor histidine kinase, partial [Desulfobacula sp.]|nr:two-component sensor histidine kinase [Desulfobacula sp.]
MEQFLSDRKVFYQVLTRKIIVLILVVSLFPLVLTTGTLVYRFHLAYTEKVQAHISELVQKHTQNMDTFLSEKLGNIRYLARQFDNNKRSPKIFLEKNLELLKNEYGEVFTDLGLVDESGIQFAYEGPFRLENADYSAAEWFIKAIDKPFYISDVFAGLRGHPHFIIAVKVRSNGSDYILRSTINFGAFNSLVENIHIGKTGMAFLINSKGQLQTQTNVELKQSIVSTMVDPSCYKNNETVFAKKKDASGNKYLCVTSMLKNIDWLMVFRQDLHDAFRDLWKTQLLTLVIFIFGCIAILSVTFTLPRNIVKLIARADQKSESMNQQVVESGRLATIGELAAGIAHEINNPVAIMVE